MKKKFHLYGISHLCVLFRLRQKMSYLKIDFFLCMSTVQLKRNQSKAMLACAVGAESDNDKFTKDFEPYM